MAFLRQLLHWKFSIVYNRVHSVSRMNRSSTSSQVMSPLRTFILYPFNLRFCSHILHNYKRRQRKRKKSEQGRVGKTTTLHVQQSFWYISSPSLYDYDVKMPTSTWPDWETTKSFSFSFWTWTLSLGIQLQKGSLPCRVVNSRFKAKFSPLPPSWYLKLQL